MKKTIRPGGAEPGPSKVSPGPQPERLDGETKAGPLIDMVLVVAPRCHLCDDAKGLLDELGKSYRLDVREIGLADEEGAAIARRHAVPFPPILMVDGFFVGHGRISRGKLRRVLDDVTASRAAR